MTPLARHLLGAEALDRPGGPPELTRATLADIARTNALFGGRAAVAWGVERLLDGVRPTRPLTLLDVGAGRGDVAAYVARRLARRGIAIRPVALEREPEAARLCRASGLPTMLADAAELPLADGSVDLVVASQLLHHLRTDAAETLVRRLDRVARLGGVVADLRRARGAAAGIWIASFLLAFHPITRHDGVLSVRRGFSESALRDLLDRAGVAARVARRPGYRLVGVWRRASAHG